MKTIKRTGARLILASGLWLLATGDGWAATVNLRADVFTIPAWTLGTNQTTPITMWGFDTTDGTFTAPTGPWSPVVITANEGDTLDLYLQNDLSGPFTEPVSIIIPGQTPVLTDGAWPCWTDGTCGPRGSDLTKRVRSLTSETSLGATALYSFTNLKPGIYLIESGTHPAVQVQMGLYGVLKVNAATAGQAYDDPSTAYDSEATLLFSEIDPVLHDAVASGQYGPNDTPPAGWLTSTVHYHPKYFLIDGQPYPGDLSALPAVNQGDRVLLRLLNAGLDTKVPAAEGVGTTARSTQTNAAEFLSLIAEDGNLMTATDASGTTLATPHAQYAVMLPAGKTMDAILTPATAGSVAIYDRRLNLTNNGVTPGGMLAEMTVN